MMVQEFKPGRTETLFSKPFVPRFWQKNRRWDPLSTYFKRDDSRTELPKCRHEFETEMWDAAKAYELKHKVRFATLTEFSRPLLNELHESFDDSDQFYGNVTIVSERDRSVLSDMKILSRIANLGEISLKDRKTYMETLKSVYGKFESTPRDVVIDRDTSLCIGIKREGYLLCNQMDWFVADHQLAPDMKRIPYGGGLLVGSSDLPTLPHCDNVVIVDGAIASGATIITLIERLRTQKVSPEFHIFAVHSGYEGLWAITRFCHSIGVHVSITVGHATHGINSKFYAVDASDRVIVGDLGDTISEIAG